MTFPAPPLEGFVVIVQHRPDVARRLEAALFHAGATVLVSNRAWETVELRKKYDAQLVVFDSDDVHGQANEPVVVDARLVANVGAIRFSAEVDGLPELMSFGTWMDVARPVADVVAAAVEWRKHLRT